MVMRFVVATHDWLPGARLSLLGHFGNVPFGSVEEAEAAARDEAAGRPISIEREKHRAKRRVPV